MPSKPMPKQNALAFIFFALAGTGYFSIFSQMDADAWIKGYAALMPIQVGVLVYFFWTGKLTPFKKHPR
jgi:hypothetical protein